MVKRWHITDQFALLYRPSAFLTWNRYSASAFLRRRNECRATCLMSITSMATTWKTIRAGVELPDDAAAQEFALKVMRGLVQSLDEDWDGVDDGGHRGWASGVAASI